MRGAYDRMKNKEYRKLKFVDICCGIGGMRSRGQSNPIT